MSPPFVSFLCPSRHRPKSLELSVESLRDNATHPDCFEVLVYLDEDDDRYPALENVRYFRGPRLGYARLYECIANGLVPHADGTWLWLWNDDALMKTEKWDVVLRCVAPNMVVNPQTNHNSHETGLNVFPAVPRAWVDLVGWARDGANDTWWQYIGQYTRTTNLPVYILHDRDDLTGNHHDDVRAGNNYDSATFYASETQEAIAADAATINGVFL